MNKNINTKGVLITFFIFIILFGLYVINMNVDYNPYHLTKDEINWIKTNPNYHNIYVEEGYFTRSSTLKNISALIKKELGLTVGFLYEEHLTQEMFSWPKAIYDNGSNQIQIPYNGDYLFDEGYTFVEYADIYDVIHFKAESPLDEILTKWLSYHGQIGTIDNWIHEQNNLDIQEHYTFQQSDFSLHTLKIGMFQLPPVSYIKDNKIYGVSPILLRQWASLLGFNLEFISGEPDKLLELFNQKEIDVLLTVNDKNSILFFEENYLVTSNYDPDFRINTLMLPDEIYYPNQNLLMNTNTTYEEILERLNKNHVTLYLTESFYEFSSSKLDVPSLYINKISTATLSYGFLIQPELQNYKNSLEELIIYENPSRLLRQSMLAMLDEKESHQKLIILLIVLLCIGLSLLITYSVRYILNLNERKRLNYLFKHDQLTYLPNTYGFTERLKKENLSYGVMILIDLRHFKLTNDLYGHDKGDRILIEWANLLTQLKDVIPSRTDSNQFMLYSSRTDYKSLLDDLFKSFDAYKSNNDFADKINISGCYLYTKDFKPDVLLIKKYLESAMHYAKNNNIIHQWVLFDDGLYQAYVKEEEMVIDIEEALANENFTLFYQPQTELYAEKTIGAEVLIRWFHKEKGTIFPDQFLSVAEKHGLMRDLDFYMIRKACEQIKIWQRLNMPYMKISVNMSTYTFESQNMAEDLLELIKKADIDTHWLALEITEESGFSDLKKASEIMKHIKTSGVRFALDDFGKGYSSLSYLEELPFDFLKIDKAFVDHIHHQEKSVQLYHLIAKLAQLYDMTIIAEGVEYKEQIEVIKAYPDTIIQGYYYSKPLSLEDYMKRIETQNDTN
ncbi:MAG: EAL domain-containing protein [Clostridia bacterium]|nr:EAL domain-containing protein [Clostridia bacterium]